MHTPNRLALLAPTTLLLLALGGCAKDDPTEGLNPGECSDGADNDADGLFDCVDPDCSGAPDCQGGTTLPTGVIGVGAGTTTGTTGSGTTTGDTTTTGTTTELSVNVTWTDVDGLEPVDTNSDFIPDINCSSDTVQVRILDPLGVTSWDFGMAETVSNGWTGEDCLNGQAGFNLCHGIGVNHTLTETCGANTIVEGSTTIFDASKDPFLTYIVDDMTDCFVFGNNPSYYATMGCTELI